MMNSEQKPLDPRHYLLLPLLVGGLDLLFQLPFWPTRYFPVFIVSLFAASFFIGIVIRDVRLKLPERKKLIVKQAIVLVGVLTATEIISGLLMSRGFTSSLIDGITFGVIVGFIAWIGGKLVQNANLPEMDYRKEVILDRKKRKRKRKKKKRNMNEGDEEGSNSN